MTLLTLKINLSECVISVWATTEKDKGFLGISRVMICCHPHIFHLLLGVLKTLFGMNSKESITFFLRKHASTLLFCAGIIFVLAVSFSTLTTKPKLWTDEAVSIEIARNFQTNGVLDVQTAPGVFTGFGERLQSTGYPVTVPLSLFFKLFGYGLVQARVYMLLWMLAVLCLLFFLGKKWFGSGAGIAAFFLVLTFASFYGSGRTVVGEIPGFLFLLVGLYFLFSRKKLLWAGFFLGFAVVSKLSVFGLIIPALVITYLFEWRKFFRTLVPIAIGMLPAGAIWILFNLKNPFLSSTWANLFHFYQNPYSSPIGSNVIHNLVAIPHSTTLLYFGAFFIAIIVARCVFGNNWKTLYNFVIVYGALAFAYYLRSPGWLRYILIAEMLALFVLPHTLSLLYASLRVWLPQNLRDKPLPAFLLSALVVIQCVQMFTVADIFSSSGATRAAESINENFPGKSVGVLNAVEVGLWLDTPKRYLAMDLTGLPQIGENPLLSEELPEVLVGYPSQRFFVEGRETLDSKYVIFGTAGGYTLYERK